MNNLLIIGAGGHGRVVKEIAEDIGIFDRIDFVDDNSPNAVGTTEDLAHLKQQYQSAVVAIGDYHVRKMYIEKLREFGYHIVTLIHPEAHVSKSARIGEGTVIEPKAVVHTGATVGVGCIISIGAVLDHDVTAQDYVHVNAGAVCMAGSRISEGTKIDAGQIACR